MNTESLRDSRQTQHGEVPLPSFAGTDERPVQPAFRSQFRLGHLQRDPLLADSLTHLSQESFVVVACHDGKDSRSGQDAFEWQFEEVPRGVVADLETHKRSTRRGPSFSSAVIQALENFPGDVEHTMLGRFPAQCRQDVFRFEGVRRRVAHSK